MIAISKKINLFFVSFSACNILTLSTTPIKLPSLSLKGLATTLQEILRPSGVENSVSHSAKFLPFLQGLKSKQEIYIFDWETLHNISS